MNQHNNHNHFYHPYQQHPHAPHHPQHYPQAAPTRRSWPSNNNVASWNYDPSISHMQKELEKMSADNYNWMVKFNSQTDYVQRITLENTALRSKLQDYDTVKYELRAFKANFEYLEDELLKATQKSLDLQEELKRFKPEPAAPCPYTRTMKKELFTPGSSPTKAPVAPRDEEVVGSTTTTVTQDPGSTVTHEPARALRRLAEMVNSMSCYSNPTVPITATAPQMDHSSSARMLMIAPLEPSLTTVPQPMPLSTVPPMTTVPQYTVPPVSMPPTHPPTVPQNIDFFETTVKMVKDMYGQDLIDFQKKHDLKPYLFCETGQKDFPQPVTKVTSSAHFYWTQKKRSWPAYSRLSSLELAQWNEDFETLKRYQETQIQANLIKPFN